MTMRVAALLAAAMPMLAGAGEFLPFSGSVNVVAKAMNRDNSSVAGTERVDDGAYTINLAYAIPFERGMGDAMGVRHEYYGLRLFKWKGTHGGDDQSFGSAGVYGVQGVAALYGRRYFVDREIHDGFGLGIFAGVASVKQAWIDFPSIYAEKSYVSPVAGVEAFYRTDVWRNLYVEPAVSFSYLKTRAGLFSTHVALNLGARF